MTTSGPPFLALSAATTFLTLTLLPGVMCRYECPSGLSKVHFLTYNADLSPTINSYERRRPWMLRYVGEANYFLHYDFMCLQGVWFERDMHNIIGRFNFKIHYSPIHFIMGGLGVVPSLRLCTPETIDKLTRCFRKNCGGAESTLKCIADKCTTRLFGLPDDCRACVAAIIHRRSKNIEKDLKRCSEMREINRINRAGLMILSDEKGIVKDVTGKYHRYHGDTDLLFERGYLHGNITLRTGKKLEYVCTHLSGYEPDYYEKRLPNIKSYEEQQAKEIDELLPKLSPRTVILGTLNTAPPGDKKAQYTTSKAFWPDNYKKFEGYKNQFLLLDGRCTYCPYTNIVLKQTLGDQGIKWSAGEHILDHILTRNVTVVDGTNYRAIEQSGVSDHFGVELQVCL